MLCPIGTGGPSLQSPSPMRRTVPRRSLRFRETSWRGATLSGPLSPGRCCLSNMRPLCRYRRFLDVTWFHLPDVVALAER